MTTTVNLSPVKLTNYLNIAYKQRERQLAVFKTQFGADSAAVAESTQELKELRNAIDTMSREDTPIEAAARRK